MPPARSVTEESGPSRSRAYFLWVLPVAFLVGVSLWLALASGGRPAEKWAFPAVALALAGLAAGSLLGYPRRPRQLSLAVFALLVLFALWVAASNLWTADVGRVWPATGRTFLYLLLTTLAFAYLTSPYARAAFKYLVMAASLVVLVVAVWQLWTASSLDGLFAGNRLVYPTGGADSAAALFLLPFWPLMWLGSGPRERSLVRGAAVGLATGMVGLAVLTQSRAAAWSLGISLLLMFALSPARLRLLFYLVVPGLLMVYAFPHLDRYWTQDPAILAGGVAGRTLTVAALAAGFMGVIVALLEGWVKVSGRMKAIFGTVILLACIGGLVYGAMVFTSSAGGPVVWFENAWGRLAAEQTGGEATAMVGEAAPPSSRAQAWSAAWQRFETDLIVGAGVDAAGPGSVPAGQNGAQAPPLVLRVLGDTGIVGGVLLFGAILAAVAGILWPRTAVACMRAGQAAGRSSRSERWGQDGVLYGWQMSLLVGLAFWCAMANMEPLWQVPGLVAPALLMLGAALARTDSKGGTLWPSLRRRLQRHAAVPNEPATRPEERRAPWTFKHFPRGHLRPEGPLSQTFRIVVLIVSATTLVLALFVYFFSPAA